MNQARLAVGVLGASALLFSACGGSGGSSSGSGSGGMDVLQVSSGFGQLLPHTTLLLDAHGVATNTLLSIRTDDDLIKNVTVTNKVLPVPQYPAETILPSGQLGSHFIYAEFTSDIDIASVLDSSPGAQSNNSLTGAVTLFSIDPATGNATQVPARVLINGYTYAGSPIVGSSPPALPYQHWVQLDGAGKPQALVVGTGTSKPGLGFPGTETDFTGSSKLVSPRAIVFVADGDGNLSTHEAFPSGRELRIRITTAVKNTSGQPLVRQATVCTTIGPDVYRPEIATSPPPLNAPVISPGQGDTNVDPLTNIRVEFTEPIQPWSLGPLPNGKPPGLSAAVRIQFGPPASIVQVPFYAKPISVFDLTTYDLIPIFNFPGEGPPDAQCGVFNHVTVVVNSAQFKDLAPTPNQNLNGANTFFTTGEGPGLVNAPVAPDTIYVGRAGAVPGLSVIDLGGFGQGTGNPNFDPTYATFTEGNTNFPNNPNVKLQGSLLRPPLAPGSCTINAGGAGVFTLTKDSSLNDLLVRAPVLTSVGDMMLGHALDSAFNNGPPPFGCQAGGGNLCAFNGKKVVNPGVNGNTMQPVLTGQINGIIGYGAENLICWAPHPNPPPLVFPPLCISPYIGGQEPTSIDTTLAGLTNLLVPGDPFGNPTNPNLPVPPSGLLTPEQNNFFEGPSYLQTTIAGCKPYMLRQQIGHYLYVIDRGRREIVVFNSNRMTVIDRIPTPDPTSLAMSPNLNLLAVVNQISNSVSFIDIDPNSQTFHTIVQSTLVGNGPRGAAWEPGNEDILVANELENTVSVISANSLTVRKVLSSQLNQPFDIAITPRQVCWGFSRNVYFAYIVNRNGKVAVMESGPNSVNGWGYDDVIGIATGTFRNPKAIQPDHVDLRSAVWIAHEGPVNIVTGDPGPFGVGAVSKLVIVSAIPGALPLNTQSLFTPQFRDMYLGVQVSLGTSAISGVPVDLAFDDLRSYSGLPNFFSAFSSGSPIPINGKQLVRGGCPAVAKNNTPRYMFVAVPNPTVGTGLIDVIRIDQGFTRVDTNAYHTGVQSIPALNVQIVMDYFRQ